MLEFSRTSTPSRRSRRRSWIYAQMITHINKMSSQTPFSLLLLLALKLPLLSAQAHQSPSCAQPTILKSLPQSTSQQAFSQAHLVDEVTIDSCSAASSHPAINSASFPPLSPVTRSSYSPPPPATVFFDLLASFAPVASSPSFEPDFSQISRPSVSAGVPTGTTLLTPSHSSATSEDDIIDSPASDSDSSVHNKVPLTIIKSRLFLNNNSRKKKSLSPPLRS